MLASMSSATPTVMHMTMTAIDPPGTTDRRWRCRECGLTGTFNEIRFQPCPTAKVGTITPAEQLEAWADGRSICPSTTGECCPDFSCCRPKLGWQLERRAAFVAADQETREKMRVGSIVAAASDAVVKAYVTRGEPKDHG